MDAYSDFSQTLPNSIEDRDGEEQDVQMDPKIFDDYRMPKRPKLTEGVDDYKWVSPWVLQRIVSKATDGELIERLCKGEDISTRWLVAMRYYFGVHIRVDVPFSKARRNFFSVMGCHNEKIIRVLSRPTDVNHADMVADLKEMRTWVDAQDFMDISFDDELSP